MRTRKENLFVFLKGIVMGAADAVPGVSGGTIAFITGIYEELVDAIQSFDLQAFRLLFSGRIPEFLAHVNAGFLVVLLAGIGCSIVLFSRVILYCLYHFPVLLWSFFFGLIVASALTVGRKIEQWRSGVIAWGLFGVAIGYFVTVAVPAQTPENAAFVFLSGAIAICAMILPGISGSFILVLLSKYEYIFTAIKAFNLPVLFFFGAGCAVGIVSFSHLLKWTLKRFYTPTIACLTGLMIGSLNKIWPWKLVLETFTSPSGKIKPLVERNVLPATYAEVTGNNPYLLPAITLAIIGFLMVYGLERLTNGGAETASPAETAVESPGESGEAN